MTSNMSQNPTPRRYIVTHVINNFEQIVDDVLWLADNLVVVVTFSVCGPDIWNSLPVKIRLIDSHPSFRRALKSHLFNIAFT